MPNFVTNAILEPMIFNDIHKAKAILEKGEVVAIPTETVYGLAANIFDTEALKKIYQIKQRPAQNPLIVHIGQTKWLEVICSEIPTKAYQLMEAFWPGPLTIILPKTDKINAIVSANQTTVGVRMPAHAKTLELLQNLDFPVAAPSANPYTKISPTTAQMVDQFYQGKLPILEGGACKSGLESTIVALENNQVICLRLGAISLEQLEEVLGEPVSLKNNGQTQMIAPGLAKKHYAPNTPLVVLEQLDQIPIELTNKKVARILPSGKKEHVNDFVLSTEGSLQQMAENFYATLFAVDQMNFDVIFIEKFPNTQLGRALNDRLDRAKFQQELSIL
ncbi:MAG: threonylcarbamoyl-AMP synthase [Flavobacteriales bacterium]|nr:threonylcarbamoyl-AMP synthase [Flavobacteriales bacterium]MBS4040017.1 threonylcarbamoyl-AMP synthase [Flavobacteriales bacterium]